MDITRMCRTCQSVLGLMDIFNEENEVLVVVLQKLADIFIKEDDLLPKQICSSCVNSLKMASEFVVQCQKTDRILRARFDKAILAEETSYTSPEDYVDLSVKIEPIEQITVQPKSSLDSITVKEEYMEEFELVENGICGGIYKKFIDDDGIEFDENDIIEVDEEFLDETTDMALVNCINEYEMNTEDTMLALEPDIVKPVAASSKGSKRAPKVKTKKKPLPIKKDKTYICSICSATFIDFTEYKAHRRTHGRYRYACKICGKQFTKSSGLQTHMVTHNGNKLECHLCGKQCSHRGNLTRHIRQVHDNIRPYSCEVCGAQFARMSMMKIHTACHSEERNYGCDTCGKKFKTSISLYVHKRIHQPDSRYKQNSNRHDKFKICICEICGIKLSSTSAYINHKRIHSDVKKFECEVCHKRFHIKLGFDIHMRSHTGERPYTCDICGKKFRQGSHLKTHKRCMHEPGAKQYTCRHCEKSFTSSGNLNVHVRIHTGERPYKCETCPSRFIDTNGLKRHRRKVHDETMDSSNAGRENAEKTVVLDGSNSITFHESDIDESNADQGYIEDQDAVCVLKSMELNN